MIPVANFCPLDFAAQRFGKFLYVFDDSGIFIRRGNFFYIVLQFFGQFRRGSIALGQYYRRLYHLPADGIRCSGNGALHYRRMFGEGAFHLERTDAVTRAFDHVVVAADEPEIAVTTT